MTTVTITTFSSFATAVGVFIAAWQLWRTHRQSITTFEDSLACEYRELAATLPTKALLGERLTDQEHSAHFDKFYRYFDLSNEQAFLHECGRISPATWQFWRDGIASNLKRPAFSRAWNEVCRRDNVPPPVQDLRRQTQMGLFVPHGSRPLGEPLWVTESLATKLL